jgi:CRISPR-associated protein Csb2
MGIHKALVGEAHPSWKLCGHDGDGAPMEGHRHVSYLVLDRDRDGYVDHLLIIGSEVLDDGERRALDRLSEISRKGGHALVLTPILEARRDVLLGPALAVASVTPFVPNRHHRVRRDGAIHDWLLREVVRECGYRGLPSLTGIEILERPLQSQRGDRWLSFDRSRKHESPAMGFGFRLIFEEPVLAPFSLGRYAHFGLGCFDAV